MVADLKASGFAYRADAKAEGFIAPRLERHCRIVTGLDKLAAEGEHRRGGVHLDTERGAILGRALDNWVRVPKKIV